MYLKKYDLSRVSYDVGVNIYYAISGYNPEDYVQYIEGDHIVLSDKNDSNSVFIDDNGNFSYYNEDCGEELEIEMGLQGANHLLLETQWRDPNVEIPETDCDVVVKLEGVIAVGKYRKEFADFTLCYSSMPIDNLSGLYPIVGWLPADNVVM